MTTKEDIQLAKVQLATEKAKHKKKPESFAQKFLKKVVSGKSIIKPAEKMTVVIPANKPSQYVPIHMKPQWETAKKSFLMR